MFLPVLVRHLECPAGELLDSQHCQGLKWKHLISFSLLTQITKWSLCGRLYDYALQCILNDQEPPPLELCVPTSYFKKLRIIFIKEKLNGNTAFNKLWYLERVLLYC